MLQQHGQAHQDKLPAVGLIGRPDHRRGFQNSLLQKRFDLLGLVGQLGRMPEVQAESVGGALIEAIGIIAAIHPQSAMIQHPCGGHGRAVMAIHTVENLGGRVNLAVDHGVNNLLCSFRAARLALDHQPQRVIHGRPAAIIHMIAVFHADQAPLGIKAGVELFHGLVYQRLSFAG